MDPPLRDPLRMEMVESRPACGAETRARGTLLDDRFGRATRPLLGHLVAVARRILGDEDSAWDAVQEALLSLWLAGEMPSNVRAWMVRAVVHRSLHLSRCRSRRRRHEDGARLGRREGSDRDDPARRLEADEFRQALSEALSAVAPGHRSVLVLSVIEQMDYAAIADTLGVPIGTVRSRLNRSRKALREALIGRSGWDYTTPFEAGRVGSPFAFEPQTAQEGRPS